ncbi:potassium-transporting ATPase subunit KdpA [Kineococcus gynurae]|uniref:Potassium-transporting ATPase potassium-binding subunit n=1 Tax=Kineococcus gynurae TaxID=452979 RepID=A0ABV5LNV7_9ACTN
MGETAAGLAQIGLLVALLAAAHVPLGDLLARTATSGHHLRVERGTYRLLRIDPDADTRWSRYAAAVLAFSLVSVLGLYALLRLQGVLPGSLGRPGMDPLLAWNTAVSFVTNTNWQSYSGEAVLGNLAQMAGLAVQNFLSAAVGLAVAFALVRGLAARGTGGVGNFFVDLVRILLRILLPLAAVATVVLIGLGVVQDLRGGGLGGPVATQEAIKLLGTNGGGFFNANSAHPLENPSPLSNLVEIFLLLVIPFSLPRAYGVIVGSVRQGLAVVGVMAVLWGVSVALTTWAQVARGTLEGQEVRFGTWGSALFAASTTATSTGAVNSMHDSFSAAGGGVVLLNMLLGEVSPGGVGSGLYGMLVLAILTVFLAGLMVGRTPEFLGKKIGRREMTLVSLYLLVTPFVVLVGTALALSSDATRAALLNSGPHGLTEMLYAFASAGNNNGSAFAGLGANTPFFNLALGLAMAVGRFVPLVLVLALAGAFAGSSPTAPTPGTLSTRSVTFSGLHLVVVVVTTALTFLPALSLGPVAESLL